MSLLRRCALNLVFIVIGIVFSLLILEGFIFRFVLYPSETPTLEFKNGLIKYQPNQRGVTRIGDEVSARFSINNNGWNSPHSNYDSGSAPTIAIIGDSYVEALQVDVDKSFAEVIENYERSNPNDSQQDTQTPITVHRYGISGAPFSQYIQILRNEVLDTHPKLIIINLVHNDFDESFKFKPGYYTSSFLKLSLPHAPPYQPIVELQPHGFEQPWYFAIRNTATFRYLITRRGIRLQSLRDLILGAEPSANPTFRANINVDEALNDQEQVRAVTHYLMKEALKLTNPLHIPLLFVMDGDRQAIYADEAGEGGTTIDRSPLALNKIAGEVASEMNIWFLDLHQTFLADFKQNHKKFNSSVDFHWNEYGHKVVGEAIVKFLDSHE